MVGSERKVI